MNGICAKKSWYMLEGLGFIIIGIVLLVLAGLFPHFAQFYYGLIFIIGGAILGIRSLATLNVPGDIFSVIAAIVLIVAGITLLVALPYTTASLLWFLSMTLWIIAVMFFIESLFRLLTNNWGFLFATSIVIAILGLILILQSVVVSAWTVSILTGIAFIVYGACQYSTGRTAKQKTTEAISNVG